MAEGASENLLKLIGETLDKVNGRLTAYRRWNSILIIGNLILSTVATLLAGGLATQGKSLADQVGGWQVGCGVVAILTAIVTISSGLHKQFKISDHLTNAMTCAAQLNALKFTATASEEDAKTLRAQYEKLLTQYNDYMA